MDDAGRRICFPDGDVVFEVWCGFLQVGVDGMLE